MPTACDRCGNALPLKGASESSRSARGAGVLLVAGQGPPRANRGQRRGQRRGATPGATPGATQCARPGAAQTRAQARPPSALRPMGVHLAGSRKPEHAQASLAVPPAQISTSSAAWESATTSAVLSTLTDTADSDRAAAAVKALTRNNAVGVRTTGSGSGASVSAGASTIDASPCGDGGKSLNTLCRPLSRAGASKGLTDRSRASARARRTAARSRSLTVVPVVAARSISIRCVSHRRQRHQQRIFAVLGAHVIEGATRDGCPPKASAEQTRSSPCRVQATRVAGRIVNLDGDPSRRSSKIADGAFSGKDVIVVVEFEGAQRKRKLCLVQRCLGL